MLNVLIALWGSALLGWLLRKWPQRWVSKLLPLAIWLMLFFIGVEVGANETLTSQLGRLGAEALAVTLICCITCAAASWAFYKYIYCAGKKSKSIRANAELAEAGALKGGAEGSASLARKEEEDIPVEDEATRAHRWRKMRPIKSAMRMLLEMKDSMIIVLFFAIGWGIGAMGWGTDFPKNATMLCLYLLLFCVGFGLGQNRDLKKNLKASKKRLLLMPIITIAATWLGAVLTALIFKEHSLTEWLAVGSGFGYYSLSSILITDIKGVELGTIALMYNVFRELAAIIFAPLLVKWAGPLSVISIGGATTADTTLPSVSRYSGKEFVPISIFHGILVDFSVPFLVPFFCAL